jgi:hypothetical protein
MSTQKFIEDLHQARQELDAATAEVMALVNTHKAFGEQWHAAIERERRTHHTLRWLMDNPVAFGKKGTVESESVNSSLPKG